MYKKHAITRLCNGNKLKIVLCNDNSIEIFAYIALTDSYQKGFNTIIEALEVIK